MSNETLEKAIAAGTTATGTFASTTGGAGVHRGSENGNGGLLNPEQSARFLDYMFDATVIGKVAMQQMQQLLSQRSLLQLRSFV